MTATPRLSWIPIVLAAAALAAACGDDDAGRPAPPIPPDEDASLDAEADTPEPPGPTCGDGRCDVGEDAASCPEDCPADAPSVCGDGTCDADEDDATCPEDCYEGPLLLHDPLEGTFHTFPDDFFTTEASDTVTGLRVVMNEETLPSIRTIPAGFRQVFHDLSQLDGFGTSAGAFFTFTAPIDVSLLPEATASADAASPLVFGWFDGEAFVRVPAEIVVADEGASLILRPLRPLPAATRAAVVLTSALTDASGRPLRPSRSLRAMIDGSAPAPLDRMTPRYREALDAMVRAGALAGDEEVAALTVFTTQSIVEVPLAIAADIDARIHTVAGRDPCVTSERYIRCTFRFEAGNYRAEDRAIAPGPGGAPVGVYTLTGDLYLPLDPLHGTPPPVILFGHGLTGDRGQAERLARHAAPLGIATVAIDAPEHGSHPVRRSTQSVLSMFDFFGLSTTSVGINAIALRDNWRAATADQLALVKLLRDGLDASDDGAPDVDGERILYLGVSLGAIMGPALLALSEHVRAAVLIVGGGRVTDILQFSQTFAPLVTLLTPSSVTRGDVARFWPLLQTAIERGDAGNWAPHVLRQRLNSSPPVQVITAMVLDDDIVPESTNRFLAHALDVPHVYPHLLRVGLLDEVPAPLAGNLDGGGTAGLLQFDSIYRQGEWRAATHNNISDSDEGIEAWLAFLQSWLETGVGEIVDAYERLGRTPPERP